MKRVFVFGALWLVASFGLAQSLSPQQRAYLDYLYAKNTNAVAGTQISDASIPYSKLAFSISAYEEDPNFTISPAGGISQLMIEQWEYMRTNQFTSAAFGITSVDTSRWYYAYNLLSNQNSSSVASWNAAGTHALRTNQVGSITLSGAPFSYALGLTTGSVSMGYFGLLNATSLVFISYGSPFVTNYLDPDVRTP